MYLKLNGRVVKISGMERHKDNPLNNVDALLRALIKN